MQLGELYKLIYSQLADAQIFEAKTESQIIIREYAGIDRGTLLSHPEYEITDKQYEMIQACINRRLVREPLQYILGSWDFMGLNFIVRPGVLIPRPDTEVLVEHALKEVHDGMKILDMCTGTGCVLISLLKYSNDCLGTAVDISDDALALAKENADRLLDLENENTQTPKIEFIKSDLFENVTDVYDIIVSNPPYIDTDVIDTLECEVKDYEPHLALDGGIDGLDLIKRIIDGAKLHLVGGGNLLMEIGYDQGERVTNLMKQAGFSYVECIKDYDGKDRVVKGIKSVLTL